MTGKCLVGVEGQRGKTSAPKERIQVEERGLIKKESNPKKVEPELFGANQLRSAVPALKIPEHLPHPTTLGASF